MKTIKISKIIHTGGRALEKHLSLETRAVRAFLGSSLTPFQSLSSALKVGWKVFSSARFWRRSLRSVWC